MRPLPSVRVLLSRTSAVLWAAPTPAPRSPVSRGHRLSGSLLPVPVPGGARYGSLLGRRRASPVPTTAVPPFRAPYAAGFVGAACPRASHLPWPSPNTPGLGSLLAPREVFLSTRQASLHAADWWLARSRGALDPALRRPGLPERRRAATQVAWSLLWPD